LPVADAVQRPSGSSSCPSGRACGAGGGRGARPRRASRSRAASFEAAASTQRIAPPQRGQVSRSIHLILATQQPSRQIINGAIQANLPCRVALYLQNPIESNMIINQPGAERLTGSGDLLYKDFGNPVRLQAPYLPVGERATLLG